MSIIQKSNELKKEIEAIFNEIKLTETIKELGDKNPLITQRLGADPYAIVYNDRVYIYMTGDIIEYDEEGKCTNNTYSKINTLNVISSADLVNWTDHGAIKAAGKEGAAKWGNNSWAPAVAYKNIEGKDRFFIYFANGGNGIGVLTSDSPIGPFVDPLGHALVSRSTPNCADVTWLFDPAVFVDDDGTGYLYVGGGVPEGKHANPGTGRVVKLGDDMISLAGEPVSMVDIPYLFEDSGINKIGNTYYYTYCSNFNVDEEATKTLGFKNGEIIYMTSSNPMGPFTFRGSILRNPGEFFGCYGNNHHCMFEFKGQFYIAYHTQILEKRLGISSGYRCTHIDPVTVKKDGSIEPITATEKGVKQVQSLNPFKQTEAVTIGTMGGIKTSLLEENGENSGTGNMIVTEPHTGDWIAVYGADFGNEGATRFKVNIKPSKFKSGAIQIRLDNLTGPVVGYVKIEAEDNDGFQEYTTELLTKVTGEHDLIFIFYGENYEIKNWYFS
ncbi:family 43 glycosylhydrolase [Mobilitalea sibirica]|uniref:Family 43 glycosylhydrolase n=1 Tax=Mobilitalea sibirica TaxID=1462919 RepID=A0A8J7H2E2_9FIRM|nr:glycoside hydrolase family 43 protein [Mobilitalea sibirica]MBH1940934.1 family 43 glycosylhydrolase [Mobilitalea sibirica]